MLILQRLLLLLHMLFLLQGLLLLLLPLLLLLRFRLLQTVHLLGMQPLYDLRQGNPSGHDVCMLTHIPGHSLLSPTKRCASNSFRGLLHTADKWQTFEELGWRPYSDRGCCTTAHLQ